MNDQNLTIGMIRQRMTVLTAKACAYNSRAKLEPVLTEVWLQLNSEPNLKLLSEVLEKFYSSVAKKQERALQKSRQKEADPVYRFYTNSLEQINDCIELALN